MNRLKASIFSSFLIVCIFSLLSVQCQRGLKVIKDAYIQTQPSPIILKDNHLDFSYNIELPAYRQVNKADSIVFISTIFDNRRDNEIDRFSFIPNKNVVVDGNYNFTHSIKQSLNVKQDTVSLAIQLLFYKNGHEGIPSEQFEIEYIIRHK